MRVGCETGDLLGAENDDGSTAHEGGAFAPPHDNRSRAGEV